MLGWALAAPAWARNTDSLALAVPLTRSVPGPCLMPNTALAAAAVVPTSWGRTAPGRGGRRLKSGGMLSGAWATTENSSGGAWSRPKVWRQPLHPPSIRVPAARQARPAASRRVRGRRFRGAVRSVLLRPFPFMALPYRS